MTTDSKKRYAVVGLGGRSAMFRKAILEPFREHCCLVGYCDNNRGRLAVARREDTEWGGGGETPLYAAEDFDRMVAEQHPDVIVVTCRDSAHDHYICRAMELGCDVITEKPMTIDERRCRAIIDLQRKTGRSCRVSFNYRYSPPRTQLKELLMSGVIGDVQSVTFNWLLNTRHGADYFRRWHRNRANSGGLLVHKATHHFDLINWMLSAVPCRVQASGHRLFYTPRTAERYGLTRRGERCHGCPESARCPFFLDLEASPNLKRRYLECEQHDGYFRDRCVFGAEIDIEDSMNLVVDYDSGAIMNYSLNAFSPWEGYLLSFNGSRGRIEHKCQESVYISDDGTVPGELKKEGTWTRIYPHWAPPYEVEVWKGTGGHGGGDTPLLDDLFSPQPPADKYLRAADQRAGAWSILTGVAANVSIATGRPVTFEELVPGIGRPDYTPMPTAEDSLPLKA